MGGGREEEGRRKGGGREEEGGGREEGGRSKGGEKREKRREKEGEKDHGKREREVRMTRWEEGRKMGKRVNAKTPQWPPTLAVAMCSET